MNKPPGLSCLDLTLPTPEENLACDEALLEAADGGGGQGTLRFWESPRHFVVLGYGNHARQEVDVDACREWNVPILRRCSGGGTVLQGPGCLNYTLVLPVEDSGPHRTITSTNTFIMERHRALMTSLLGREVSVEGVTDLAVAGRKFSGNAQRRRHDWLLFHGTFLLHFDLQWVGRVLKMPARRPEYRGERAHADFLCCLGLPAERVKRELRDVWSAGVTHPGTPRAVLDKLIEQKYGSEQWNLRR